MNRGELGSLLGQAPDVSSADLLKARSGRLAELREQLQQDGLPKPVKIMLSRELGELESPDSAKLAAELEQIARADALLADIAAELDKPGWTRAVVELLCNKLKPLVPGIPDEGERFKFEKRLAEITEKLKAAPAPPPPPPPPVAPPPLPPPPLATPVVPETPKPVIWNSAPQHDPTPRLESYFAEISAERAKPQPAYGVIRLWMQKIGTLVDQLPDEQARMRYEKRLVEIEYLLDGSQPPWPKPGKEPVKAAAAPVAPAPSSPPTPPAPPAPAPVVVPPPAPVVPKAPGKPVPGTLLQILPKPADGTLRRSGTPVHFVARPRFVLGRKQDKADFVTNFLPATPANQQKTNSVSRVNTTLFFKSAQLWVQDGEILPDGKIKPSAGTAIDGQVLTAAPLQLNFIKERTLRLGETHYELKALHLLPASPEGPWGGSGNLDTASSQVTVVQSSKPVGCLRFQSVSCREVEFNAVWLFNEASLGADASCAAVLDGAGLPPIALRVHHWEKGFWLSVPGSGRSKITLDGETLSGGDVRALQAAHQLVLGTMHCDLKVSP